MGQIMSSSYADLGRESRPALVEPRRSQEASYEKKQYKIINSLKKNRGKMLYCVSATSFVLVILVGSFAVWGIEDVGVENYFETPQENKLNLDVLPEYRLERHTFSVPGTDEETTLYRIPGGPKSKPKNGKQPTLIQYGIICDIDRCSVNQPLIAMAYLLVDQGYDVWLGQSNSSIAGNIISSENLERERLAPIGQYILAKTGQPELSVMGYFNGSTKIFAITSSSCEPDESNDQSPTIRGWLGKIPGIKTVKNWYDKGRNYLKESYNKVIGSLDYLGKKVDYIIDDLTIRELKEKVLNTLGIVSTMVLPTLNVDDFSKILDHPDVRLSTSDLLLKYGYQSEIHKILTDDGYILTAHRITGGPKHPPGDNKPVIILQHGILSSSADWIIMGPSKSLGYLLADEGYDVWMSNSRGNTYSKAHKTISTTSSDFWDFTWHEMGVHDTPAVIDYVLNLTEQNRVAYVGHSQGMSQLLVTLSEKPEYNSKISMAVGLAPMAYAGNMRSPLVTTFARISTPLYHVLRLAGINSFLPTNAFLTEIGRDICEGRSLLQIICSNALFLATGYDSTQINRTMVPIILGHTPAGASIKQFLHYAQLYNSKKFQHFDRSISIFNRHEPAEYNLQNVRVKMAIFYGKNDLLADNKDVDRLVNALPNVVLKQEVENFNHIDFLYGDAAPRVVYKPVIEYLQQIQNLAT